MIDKEIDRNVIERVEVTNEWLWRCNRCFSGYQLEAQAKKCLEKHDRREENIYFYTKVPGGKYISYISIDQINPQHYKGREVMDFLIRFGLDKSFCLGNVVKYIARDKNNEGGDKRLVDLKKAKWYLEEEIRIMEGGDAN
jgi:hypothetical protein